MLKYVAENGKLFQKFVATYIDILAPQYQKLIHKAIHNK